MERKLTFIEAQGTYDNFKKEIERIQRSISYSNGFLRSLKERYGIRQLSMLGEKLSSDSQSIKGYLKDAKALVESEGHPSIIVLSQDYFWEL